MDSCTFPLAGLTCSAERRIDAGSAELGDLLRHLVLPDRGVRDLEDSGGPPGSFSPASSPLYHRLVMELGKRTGRPAVMNR